MYTSFYYHNSFWDAILHIGATIIGFLQIEADDIILQTADILQIC